MSELAVVTGATGALGSAIVACLRSAGLTVVAIARSESDLEQLASGDERIVPVAADLGDDAATNALAAALHGRVRVVVHAAGLPTSGTLEAITPGEITRGVDVKIGGLVRVLRAVEPHLGDGSRIVVLGGHYGYEPSPAAPLAGYRAGSPLGRLTTIEEVAWAVGILLAPEAAALHGATLSLDLGRRRGIG